MLPIDRRAFLLKAGAGAALLTAGTGTAAPGSDLAIAPFRFDVTPPVGHSLCGGWIKPVEAVDDPLEAIGFVLLGSGKPVVVCAVDWTGLSNEAHVSWRTALAEAAGTTPDRVAVQCVHQHNAPFACLDAERSVAAQGDLPHIVDLDFYRKCLDRGRKAVADGLKTARRVTHVAGGKARVDRVASNRRVNRDAAGKVLAMRGSATKDPKIRDLPEGLIDPWLRTVAFYDKDVKLAACHYYATHPMSYYGDGRVSSDFVGLARKQRQKDEPNCLHVYFTGCAGNVTAGKYNDGSKENRPVLTRRIYDAIVAADATLKPEPVGESVWRTGEILPPARAGVTAEALEEQVGNKKNQVVGRNRPAYQLAWVRRTERAKPPIVLSALHVNDVTMLHLPAECFVEYQLRAQVAAPKRFVAAAGYGDGGPWYIPTREEYPFGGYEVSVAFCDPGVDQIITTEMQTLLKS
ncbi:hypothetical protein [Fimbriiglobus ruber]|uniref:Neutral/alkaline non-lysosomal ceramidase N-terminal domain-containing protein n=1 Tax=Fimbriiglobus ruber TaxID=1908690 RepID=A0A225E2M5_9BACT|nr:hypothetical protein [Fimbriiglobus ruber]OWK44326.1 hypothetical protein FRUB_02258 [Fimbriiglobus ruber]